jgi:hypothetical protein
MLLELPFFHGVDEHLMCKGVQKREPADASFTDAAC